jgi:quercetin dioxygenase-like cupin family protein
MSKPAFLFSNQVPVEQLSWGQLKWFSRPDLTGAKSLVMLEATLEQDGGHDFHFHPGQEEIIVILEGRVEQWLERERRILSAGDSVFIPADCVHATFNIFPARAKTLALLGPALGPKGYSATDVSQQSPWNELRKQAAEVAR